VIEALRIRRFSRFHWVKKGDLPTKFFFNFLKDKFKVILEKERIGRGFNKSLIVLIPKSSDPNKVKEFRSISLLGGVYKIIAKILANKIRLLVPKLVHPNQYGFIHGRLLAKTCLLLWFGVEEGPKLGRFILLKVDFEKAYDRIE